MFAKSRGSAVRKLRAPWVGRASPCLVPLTCAAHAAKCLQAGAHSPARKLVNWELVGVGKSDWKPYDIESSWGVGQHLESLINNSPNVAWRSILATWEERKSLKHGSA